MLKAMIVGLVVTFLLPISALAAFDTNLRYGAKGEAVVELQEFLTEQGIYKGPVTGRFYSLTLAAVKSYQKREHIKPVSGYFGPLSRARAQELTQISEEVEETLDLTPAPAPEAAPALPDSPVQGQQPQNVQNPIPDPQAPVVPNNQQITPMSQARIEIVNPSNNWAVSYGNRPYKANPALAQNQSVTPVQSEDANYLVIGAIVYDDAGNPVNNAQVVVNATDSTQSKSINGTGSILGQPKEGFAAGTPYYPYSYELRSVGQHTITFTANGLTKSITVNAQ